MRDLMKVIADIRKEIPPEKTGFMNDLKHLEATLLYTAPEAIMSRWYELGAIFNMNVPYPPKEEWHRKVVAIFMDKPLT